MLLGSGLIDDENFLRKLFYKHAFSSTLSMLGVMASTIANSIIAGRFFGSYGLAAMSVVAPLYLIYASIGALVGVGGSTLSAHALGQDDQRKSNVAFTCSLILCIIFSVVTTVLILTFEDRLLFLLGCTDATYYFSKSYSTIYVIGGIGTALFYLPYNFLKLVGKLKFLIMLFIGMAIENAVLDILFCSTMELGMSGIALGTVVSSIFTSIVGIVYLLRGKNLFKLVLDSKIVVKNTMIDLVKIGSPAMMNNLTWFLQMMLMNRLILSIASNVGLMSFSLVNTLEDIATVLLSGLSQATSSFVGVFWQEKDNVSLRRIEKLAHRISLTLIILLVAAVWIFPNAVCDIFGVTGYYERYQAIIAVKIVALSLIPEMWCLLLLVYYETIGFTTIANVISIFKTFVLVLVPAYLLSPIFGINAVWYSFLISGLGTILIVVVMLKFEQKPDRDKILLLDLTSERNGAFISFSVKSDVASITDSVEKIVEFCQQNHLSKKETMLVRLSMEEMMVSIRDHCLESDDKKMDLRILVTRDESEKPRELTLRIRYDGKVFDPLAYYENNQTESDEIESDDDTLGIKMILNAAREVHYKSTFGINNLAVVLDCEGD